MYRESYVSKQQDETERKLMMMDNVREPDLTPENPVLNWAKVVTLLAMTYGLVALLWLTSNAIEHMKDNDIGQPSVPASFQAAGGLILGLFCAYVFAFGVAWYCGYQKRDQIRRDVVERQIAREKALQARNNII